MALIYVRNWVLLSIFGIYLPIFVFKLCMRADIWKECLGIADEHLQLWPLIDVQNCVSSLSFEHMDGL